jgi:hypothetical protein
LVVLMATAALAIAGCSGFGGSKQAEGPPPDPNTFPANYRTQIATFLRQSLTNRVDFRGATIAAPALKPIGDSQRYMVCVQFNAKSQITTKVAIYLAGQTTQFVDATAEQCTGAAYQPFKELEAATPAS